jgi:hypothetical protein
VRGEGEKDPLDRLALHAGVTADWDFGMQSRVGAHYRLGQGRFLDGSLGLGRESSTFGEEGSPLGYSLEGGHFGLDLRYGQKVDQNRKLALYGVGGLGMRTERSSDVTDSSALSGRDTQLWGLGGLTLERRFGRQVVLSGDLMLEVLRYQKLSVEQSPLAGGDVVRTETDGWSLHPRPMVGANLQVYFW